MEVQFVGAAQTVTGSMHLVRTRHGNILLDCGLYQGRRRESYQRNKNLPVPTDNLIAVALSHAHIDHSGALPMLVRRGWKGPVYSTPATRDLATVMLRDSAYIQEQDARHLNKQRDREHLDVEVAAPLYDEKDVLETISRFHSVPYGFRSYLNPHICLTFVDAGHVLGSAITILEVEENGKWTRLAFTGDLGRMNMPILEDPVVPENIDVLITESTYGDRLHDDIEKMDDDLAAVVKRTYERGGKVIIPSFALERAQEVVFALKKLRKAGRLPNIPVYVDSPLTVKITDVFKLHPECYDDETRQMLKGHDSPFEFPELRYIEQVEDSKAITASNEPAIIISASGMCEAGRILHHLRGAIESPNNTVLIVGYQAQHTLGRRLVEHRQKVRIFGVERERRAEVVVLNGFSAHADQGDLLSFADQVKAKGPLKRIALVHGDPKPQKVLSDKLVDRGHERPFVPAPGDVWELPSG
jgi:metallo-beta-lactamase family protein